MARAEKIVLDASVVVKWFNVERSTSKALELRNMHINNKLKIYAPELLLYEVINALRRNPGFDEKDVQDAYGSLIELMITFTKAELDLAIGYAYQYKLTIYDTSYISLAKKLGAKLVTADEKLCKKAGQEKYIVALGDWVKSK